MTPYETLHSETIFTGKVFSIRRDLVRLPDGRESRLDIVEHSGSVVIIPIDEAGQVLFVRQYRHPVGSSLLELPAGMINPGEEPLACARRELREETGMAAARFTPLGGFFLAPGYSTEYMHVFLAQDLTSSPLQPDEDEFIHVERVPQKDVPALARQGHIPDAKTLAALLLLSQN